MAMSTTTDTVVSYSWYILLQIYNVVKIDSSFFFFFLCNFNFIYQKYAKHVATNNVAARLRNAWQPIMCNNQLFYLSMTLKWKRSRQVSQLNVTFFYFVNFVIVQWKLKRSIISVFFNKIIKHVRRKHSFTVGLHCVCNRLRCLSYDDDALPSRIVPRSILHQIRNLVRVQ